MSVRPLDAQEDYARVRFGVWPEDADEDGALGEVAKALDATIAAWSDIRTAYRTKLLDLTATPYGRVKAAAAYIAPKVVSALTRLDRVIASVNRELASLDGKHIPKLGTVAETMVEGEVRGYLRALPEGGLTAKLAEAAATGDIVTLRAALLAPPTLLTIPEGARETVVQGYGRAVDPEGFARRELLERATKMINHSGQALMVETQKLIPGWVAQAEPHDQRAADTAQRLVERETARAVAEAQLEPREEGLILQPRAVAIAVE